MRVMRRHLLLAARCCHCCSRFAVSRRACGATIRSGTPTSPRRLMPPSTAVQSAAPSTPFSASLSRRGWRLHDVTRVCVCLFFYTRGPLRVPAQIGAVGGGVAADVDAVWADAPDTLVGEGRRGRHGLIILGARDRFQSSARGTRTNTAHRFLFCLCMHPHDPFFSPPLQLGLFLLLVDVATDTLDLLARLTLSTLVGQPVAIDELTAKKLSLLGVMALVATHRYREERANLKQRAARAASSDKDAKPLVFTDEIQVPHLLLLIGRILMASIFFYAAGTELTRLLLPERLQDIDPDDPHNVIWPKLLEITLAIPFVFGLWTTGCARARGDVGGRGADAVAVFGGWGRCRQGCTRENTLRSTSRSPAACFSCRRLEAANCRWTAC